MPAGYTHMTLSRQALNKLDARFGSQFRANNVLSANLGTFLVGSLAPDLPYAGFTDDLWPSPSEFNEVADELHTAQTTAIPFAALEYARDLNSGGKIDEAQSFFSFYTGYISHIVADGFIHPFIRDRVGDYGPMTQGPHRILEMKIDILVLNKFLSQQANGVSPETVLTQFEDDVYRKQIFEFYSKALKRFHNKELSSSKLNQLADGIRRMLSVAANESPQWYRTILGDKGLHYFNLDEVIKEEAKIRTLNEACDCKEKGILYNSYGLDPIDVIDDVIPMYFRHMPKVIEAVYSYVFENDPDFHHLVPTINLDNGRLLSDQNLASKPAFIVEIA